MRGWYELALTTGYHGVIIIIVSGPPRREDSEKLPVKDRHPHKTTLRRNNEPFFAGCGTTITPRQNIESRTGIPMG